MSVPIQSIWEASSSQVDAGSANYTASGTYTPQFPNVPNLPGVPLLGRLSVPGAVGAAVANATELLRLSQQLGTTIAVAFGLNPLYSGLGLQPLLPSYSIIPTAGTTTFKPDSFIEMEVRAPTKIMTHPVEPSAGGSSSSVGFEAYNRVQDQISIRMQLACQGKKMRRSDFLSALESMKEGTDLYTLAFPDATYKNMALLDYGYKQSSEHGAVTIWADTQWLEARSTNVAVTTPTSSQPQGAMMLNYGSIGPQIPAPLTLAAITAPAVTPAFLPADISNEAPPSLSAF